MVTIIGRHLCLSCLFCPATLELEVCDSLTQCNRRHFLSRGLVHKQFDDRKDLAKFRRGVLVELNFDLSAKKFNPKLIIVDKVLSGIDWCNNQNEALPLVPNFGLGGSLSFWLCARCSFKNKKDNERLNAIHDALSRKSKIWKEYWNETEPKFLKECEIEESFRRL